MDTRNLARQLAIAAALFGAWIAFTGALLFYWNLTSGTWPAELYLPAIGNLCVGIALAGGSVIYLRADSRADTE